MFNSKTETLSKQRVLLIEDNPVDAHIVQGILSEAIGAQFHLECADDLSGGLERLKTGGIDLVLLDLSLPDSDSGETFGRVHNLVPQVPIIILSGQDNEDLAIKIVQEGAQDYLVKGQMDRRSLLRSMRYAIKRKQSETALAQERDLLHTLLDNTSDRIYFKDQNSRLLRLNPALAAHVKLSDPKEGIGKSDFDFFTSEHALAAFSDEQRIIRSGQPVSGIIEKETHPDGRITWAFTSKMPLRDKKGRIIGTFGISRDITEIKNFETALAAEREELKKANAELLQSREELLKALADLKQTNEELKTTQFQLIQAAKLESIGTLAAGVAHEVKNPLQTILMGIDFLANHVPTTNENATMVLTEIRDAVRRADSIVRDLLEFSASHHLIMKDEDLNSIIEKTSWLVNYELTKSRVALVKQFSDGLPLLKLDKTKMEQVFINLFMNAIHAMPDGGTLTIKTSQKQLQDAWPADDPAAIHFKTGEHVIVIEVEDTGIGIPQASLGKIFQPFFTTKPAGKGTGLGLPVTKNIIELHSGTIDLKNLKDRGVRVTILLKTQPATRR